MRRPRKLPELCRGAEEGEGDEGERRRSLRPGSKEPGKTTGALAIAESVRIAEVRSQAIWEPSICCS